MAKIGIMGGTFDPIHIGHIRLAQQALSEQELDFILFVPNHIPWMKRDRKITSAEHRMSMVKLAIKDCPKFQLSSVEVDAGGESYTWQTLEFLKKQYPQSELYFILGADSLFSIDKWAHPEKIMKNSVILAAVRDDCDRTELEKQKQMLAVKYYARIILLSMPPVDVSSTKIRQRFYTDPEVKQLVPKDVGGYIVQNHLYEV